MQSQLVVTTPPETASDLHLIGSIPNNAELASIAALEMLTMPDRFKQAEQSIKNYCAAHRDLFWKELSKEEDSLQFMDINLGSALSDSTTLKESGALDLLKQISATSSKAGRQSLWVTTNIAFDSVTRELRRAAIKEIGSSAELQVFVARIFRSIENLDRALDRIASGGSLNFDVSSIKSVNGYISELRKALASPPQISSLLLKNLIDQISNCVNSGSLLAMHEVQKVGGRHYLQHKNGRLEVPKYSYNRLEQMSAASVWVGAAAFLGGIIGSAIFKDVELWRLTALAPISSFRPYFHYIGKAQSCKLAIPAFNYIDDKVRSEITPLGGLLSELYSLGTLRSRFPNLTSFTERSEDGSLQICNMRNPLKCLQGANPVPSDVLLKSGVPLLIGGQNTGGKTFYVNALIQNTILDGVGAPLFGTNVRIPNYDKRHMQVPRQSTGTLGGGRFETEARETLKFASIVNGLVILALDEVGGGTSREEARPIQCLAIGELAAKGYNVVAISHDYKLIHAVVENGLAESLEVELDENQAPTFRLIPGIPTSSGYDPVINMTGLAEEKALERIRSFGGNEEVYWNFRNET